MKSPWPRYGHLDANLFYDQVDEKGHDKQLPPAPNHRFVYQPDPISNRLVALQEHIHTHHRRVEEGFDSALNSWFQLKWQIGSKKYAHYFLESWRWTRTEVPPRLPDLGLIASTMLVVGASHPPGWQRWSWTLGLGMATTIALFPELRNRMIQHSGFPLNSASDWWNEHMLHLADGWNILDQHYELGVERVKAKRQELRQWWETF